MLWNYKLTSKKKRLLFSVKNFWFFLELICSVSSSHFWPFNFMCAISTTKKKLLKRKGNSITPAKTNAPISQTSSECLKLTTQTYQMKAKNLIMKFGQLQEEITKASLPVSADLSNDFASIILETDQRKI